MAKTKQILLTTTVKTTGAWQPNRLVSFAGKQAENGEAVLGTSVYEADVGDQAAVDVIGIALVEAGAAIAAGVPIAAGLQGLAIAQTGTAKIVGTAIDAATAAGEVIRIKLNG
ncbi:MAG: capsid cement protein [Burkholderiaceae bacterium]